jgi:peptide/nickel transport system ATP-binding protein/oligopeptide transport system ATP-binding protein
MTPLLSVKDLHISFHGRRSTARAVEGIDFHVGKGETVCLVGESGCGKTVSALALLGLLPVPPASIPHGSALFRGRELLGMGEDELRTIRGRRISMVFQEPMTSLNPVFTIGEQIQEAILAHEDTPEEDLRRRAAELLKDTGISYPEERMDDYPHQLSGGQRQRVMIAMALACGPDLVIADEPTTALDVTIQVQILDLFRRLQESRGLSLLYITHDLGVVAHIADRVYVMYAGSIAEQGTLGQVFNEPLHPYTQGLLASLPSRTKRGKRLESIHGAVPDPARKPSGCPFHPRCPRAENSCKDTFPEMCDWGGGHYSRCPVIYKDRGGRP